MATLVHILLADPASAVAFAGGLLVMLGTLVLSWRRSRRIEARSRALLSMALQGRPDEARIQARMEGHEFAPFLAALGGELEPPSRRRLVRSVVDLAVVFAVPTLVLGNSLRVLYEGESGSKVSASVLLLVGAAVLVPVAAVCAVLVLDSARSSARAMRGAVISVLARTVRPSLDTELASALRRHRAAKDGRSA